MSALATRFGRQTRMLRATVPLTDDAIRQVAPSIFAQEPHESRSTRYTYIPTVDVLAGLRKNGFEPFMVAQARSRLEGRRDHTKHMLRLRHASQIAGAEAQEIILINSHDGSSSYQMLAGMFRFVCCNGMVWGDTTNDVRVPHKGNIVHEVIDGAFEVLDGFTRVVEETDAMKALTLNPDRQAAFARAALELKYDTEAAAAPITEDQVLRPRRIQDRASDLWTTFNRVQENLVRGGLPARTASNQRTRTRPVEGIDGNVRLNRALWVLASEMRKLAA